MNIIRGGLTAQGSIVFPITFPFFSSIHGSPQEGLYLEDVIWPESEMKGVYDLERTTVVDEEVKLESCTETGEADRGADRASGRIL